MRRIYFFILFAAGAAANLCFAHNNIEVDLSAGKVQFSDFCLGDLETKGEFSFNLKEENGSLILALEGKDVSLWKRTLPWIKAKLIKRGDRLFINYIYSPEFMLKGEIDLAQDKIFLDLEVNSAQGFASLGGDVKAKAKVWGKLDDFLVTGSVTIENGKYKKRQFSRLSLNFLGKLPLLNLTDSCCVLTNGSIYKIEGALNLADFNNLFPAARFVSQKVSLNGWELLFEEEKNVGLKKGVDGKFDIVFDTYRESDNFMDRGAELRYKLNTGEFLRWRMQEDKTIVGFERKKEF